jgi:hypothetical protein
MIQVGDQNDVIYQFDIFFQKEHRRFKSSNLCTRIETYLKDIVAYRATEFSFLLALLIFRPS